MKAKFDIIGNDLYWEVTFFRDDEWFKCKWVGYDDDNWWLNVSPNMKRRTFTGNKGSKITLEIDFVTCKVKEIEL